MSEEWQPEQYHDTYREDVMALIEQKIAANETHSITMPGPEKERAAASNVIDLVSLLQASLGKKPKGAAADEEEEEAPAPKARKAPAKAQARAPAANEEKPARRAAAAKTSSASKASHPAKPPTRRKKAA
jgi:DNA end-binding protein Ku